MRNEDYRQVTFRLNTVDKFQNLRLNGNVKCRRRLVTDKDIGVCRQCDCNYDTLAHAAAELKRVLIVPDFRFGNTHFFKQFQCFCLCHLGRNAINEVRSLLFEVVDQRNHTFFRIEFVRDFDVVTDTSAQAVYYAADIFLCQFQVNYCSRYNLPIGRFAAFDQLVSACRFLVETSLFARIFHNAVEVFLQSGFKAAAECVLYAVFDYLQSVDGFFHRFLQFVCQRISLFFVKFFRVEKFQCLVGLFQKLLFCFCCAKVPLRRCR